MTLPHDLDVEKSLLGCCLQGISLSGDAMSAAIPLPMDAFYDPQNAEIWAAMLSIYHRKERIDLTTVVAELKQKDHLQEAGGISYIGSLQAYFMGGDPESYAKILRSLMRLRRLKAAADHAAFLAVNPGDPLEILAAAERAIMDSTADITGGKAIPADQSIPEALREIEACSENRTDILGVPTGFRDLDALLGGLLPGTLITIAGTTGTGKTSLALNILAHAAIRAKSRCAIFSLEMERTALVKRMLSAESGINHYTLRHRPNLLSESDWLNLAKTADSLSKCHLYIDDSGSLSTTELRAKVMQHCSRLGLDLLVVDYLQLLRSAKRSENRQQEVDSIVRDLKALAKEARIPVIALSQLSREVDKRDGKKPRLSDLRESGAIEQNSDVVIFIWHEENGGQWLLVEKHRNGPTGEVAVEFTPEITRFEEVGYVTP